MLKTLIKLQFQKALARYTANSSNKKKNGKKSSFNSPAVYLALLAFVGVVFAFYVLQYVQHDGTYACNIGIQLVVFSLCYGCVVCNQHNRLYFPFALTAL